MAAPKPPYADDPNQGKQCPNCYAARQAQTKMTPYVEQVIPGYQPGHRVTVTINGTPYPAVITKAGPARFQQDSTHELRDTKTGLIITAQIAIPFTPKGNP